MDYNFITNNLIGWQITEDKKLRKEFSFNDFSESMTFINTIAKISEQNHHHPDIHIYYNKVIIELWTHSTKEITDKDIKLAKEIDQLVP